MPPEIQDRLSVPSLHNGISTQPPNIRLPNQVADAENANFSVVDGLTRRPGSWIQQHLVDALLPAANNRMHAIVRDQDERYLVVHNRTSLAAMIKVLELSTNRWGTVDITVAAQNYLDAASPDEFRFRTIVDYTLIVNTDIELAGTDTSVGISSNTLANPTVVTTAANHNLATGDVVTITGSNSTPSIDGSHTVTVTGATTFTIPVNVTGAGTAGTVWFGELNPETMPVKMVRQNTGGTGTITANSTANPTVVTSAGHGLVSGQTVVITGSNSTPTIDGTRVVTVINANTFSVPVDTSAGVAGTAGTWTSKAYFTIDVITWDQRASGTTTTNPLAVLWSEGRKISDATYWQGRLWLFGDEWAVSSQAQDLFNFWIENVSALGDADPIKAALSSEEVTVIDYAVPVRQSILLFTKAGKQFELAAGSDAVTPTTIKAKPLTTFRSLPVRPEVMDPSVYFASDRGCNIQLLEYAYDEIALPTQAEDVSAHVPTLMPLRVDVPDEIGSFSAEHSELRRICVSTENQMVFLLRRDKVVDGEVFSRFIYVYRTHYLGERRVQSAWTRWALARPSATVGIRGIHDMAVIGNYLYLLAHCGTDSPPDFFILRVNIPAETECDEAPEPTTQT